MLIKRIFANVYVSTHIFHIVSYKHCEKITTLQNGLLNIIMAYLHKP